MRAQMRTLGALCLLLALAACAPPPSAAAPPAASLQPAVAIAAVPVAAPGGGVPVDACGVDNRAVDLIIAYEVGSPQLYERKYRGLVYPGGASGATGGYGYDFGHRKASVIAIDWEQHPHAVRLSSASGVTGPLARDVVKRLADIVIEQDLARTVFDQTSLIEHLRLARRAFGREAFCAAPAGVRGALTSLVFNRGAAMQGHNRSEMRAIRDTCLPARDWGCVAHQLRTMVRVWRGTDIERGMANRRRAEAQLAEATA
jgi:GH24 family phage-related lysozyme (muramidase)